MDYKNITLGECYDKLLPIIQSKIGEQGMSKSNYNSLVSAYKNYLEPLSNREILSIKKKEIQEIINKSHLKHTGRGYIKNIFSRIIDYCVDELELNIDKSIYNLNIGEKKALIFINHLL